MDETKSKLNRSSRFWTNGTGRREKGVPVRPGIVGGKRVIPVGKHNIFCYDETLLVGPKMGYQ